MFKGNYKSGETNGSVAEDYLHGKTDRLKDKIKALNIVLANLKHDTSYRATIYVDSLNKGSERSTLEPLKQEWVKALACEEVVIRKLQKLEARLAHTKTVHRTIDFICREFIGT